MFKKILKTLTTLIETAVLAVFLLLALCAVSYRKTGKGIGFLNYEDYKTFIISLKGNVSTVSFGNMPLPNEIKPVAHRKNSEYDNLTHNEKIVYDSLLTRSYQILRGIDLTTTVNVPIDDMDFTGLEECKTYNEIKEKVVEGLSQISYENVYKAFHIDYDYLTWWEYDMEWEISEPILNLSNSKLKDSLFIITMKPTPIYGSDLKVSEEAAKHANETYENAKIAAKACKNDDWQDELECVKDYVIDTLSYDEVSAEEVFKDNQDERTVSSRNYMNAFDDDPDTNAICGGYSAAFQLMCDLLESEEYTCYKANGSMTSMGKEIQHTWNIVEKDGVRYMADITNSDKGAVGQTGSLFLTEIDDGDSYTVVTRIGRYTYKED